MRLLLLPLALILALAASSGCAQLDDAYWRVRDDQRTAAQAAAQTAMREAIAKGQAQGLDRNAIEALALAAAKDGAREYMNATASSELLDKLRAELPAMLAKAGQGDYLGAGLGGTSILGLLLLFLYQRARHRTLSAGVAATLPPQLAAILNGDAREAGRQPPAGSFTPISSASGIHIPPGASITAPPPGAAS